jgi:hypothetical protein
MWPPTAPSLRGPLSISTGSETESEREVVVHYVVK